MINLCTCTCISKMKQCFYNFYSTRKNGFLLSGAIGLNAACMSFVGQPCEQIICGLGLLLYLNRPETCLAERALARFFFFFSYSTKLNRPLMASPSCCNNRLRRLNIFSQRKLLMCCFLKKHFRVFIWFMSLF